MQTTNKNINSQFQALNSEHFLHLMLPDFTEL